MKWLIRFMVFAGCAAAAAPHVSAGRDRPNILFIHADDLGYGDLGCYGQMKIKTPVLDKLASDGLRFTSFYAGSTVCAPSRSCLMTGRHTGHTRIRGNARDITLLREDVTVARLLKDAGYVTACVGKWGLGNTTQPGAPNLQGFDHFFGYTDHKHAHNYFPDFLWRNSEKVPTRNVIDWPDGGKMLESGGVARVKLDYSPDLCLDEAVRWLDTHGRSPSTPFFLYFASTLPHANNEAGQQGMEIPGPDTYSESGWPSAQANRAAMVTRLDSDVGKLLDKLDALGLAANTLVIFTSDNGPHREGGGDPEFFDSNGPLRGIKRDLYEGGIRVPMIARWRGRIAAGKSSATPLAHWDFLPTFCELAGASPPPHLDGRSFIPTLFGTPEKQSPHPFLYWEFFENQPRFAVRRGPWKAIFWARGAGQPARARTVNAAPRAELYNLDADLGETTDLAAQHPEIVAELKSLAAGTRTRSDHPAWNFAE